MNRFIKVYIDPLTYSDLYYISMNTFISKYTTYEHQYTSEDQSSKQDKSKTDSILWTTMNRIKDKSALSLFNRIGDIEKMIKHMIDCIIYLDTSINVNHKYGYKNGPYEFNLRDIFRWSDLVLTNEYVVLNDSD